MLTLYYSGCSRELTLEARKGLLCVMFDTNPEKMPVASCDITTGDSIGLQIQYPEQGYSFKVSLVNHFFHMSENLLKWSCLTDIYQNIVF